MVDIGHGLESTGDISYYLDPAGSSFLEWNFNNIAAFAHLELLATFQLQVGNRSAPPSRESRQRKAAAG
jgi:hypothetical protein